MKCSTFYVPFSIIYLNILFCDEDKIFICKYDVFQDFYLRNDNCFGPWIDSTIVTPSSENQLQLIATKSTHDNQIYLCNDDFDIIKRKTERYGSSWFEMNNELKQSVFLKWSNLISANIQTLTSIEYFNRNMHIQWTTNDILQINEYLKRCSNIIHKVSNINKGKSTFYFQL